MGGNNDKQTSVMCPHLDPAKAKESESFSSPLCPVAAA